MTSTARNLAQRLNRRQSKPEKAVDDPFAIAFAKRLEHRGIVSGIVEDDEPHHKKVLRLLTEDKEAAERAKSEKAKLERESETQQRTASVGEILMAALNQANNGAEHMPLNGEQVLRSALAALDGGNGTINGEPS